MKGGIAIARVNLRTSIEHFVFFYIVLKEKVQEARIRPFGRLLTS